MADNDFGKTQLKKEKFVKLKKKQEKKIAASVEKQNISHVSNFFFLKIYLTFCLFNIHLRVLLLNFINYFDDLCNCNYCKVI